MHLLDHPAILFGLFLCLPGAWETKVSNREKKQQRRKDKGTEDSGSPAGVGSPKASVEVPVTKAPTKKNKGSNGNVLAVVTIWGFNAKFKARNVAYGVIQHAIVVKQMQPIPVISARPFQFILLLHPFHKCNQP